ncbi:MAG TPA: class I SAM-dependent methyltransferase [Pseudonocardiaceae bacterium]|nr:class I SAM-dependent methyltransferase [Pseudonocardiaceae bacterium]
MSTDRLIDGSRLDGVSATTLWTLRNRAIEALRPDSLIDDPWAVRIYEAIEYDYDRFGPPSQSHALRARAFDKATKRYLAKYPDATVVQLGAGLQTAYWRLGRPDVDWLTVDLAPITDLRATLLPDEPRMTAMTISALDRGWLDRVDPTRGVLICAEGLFMYFQRSEVMSLIADCSQRFPGGQLIFDSIPPAFSERTLQGVSYTDHYSLPPMPFGLTVSEAVRLPRTIQSVIRARDVMMPPGRGVWRYRSMRMYANLPWMRNQRPSITLLTFAKKTPSG